MPQWFPLKEKMYNLIGSWQGNSAPMGSLHATLHLTALPLPPLWSSLVAQASVPLCCLCQAIPCLPSRLAPAGQTLFIAWFSIAILSGDPTPVPPSQASLLGSEPLVAVHCPPSVPPHPRPCMASCFSHSPSLSQSALFPIRGACILNVSTASVSVATVPLLPHPPSPLPKTDTRVGGINLQFLARYQMCWVEANCHRKCL